jgi:broad specificity phosphatase PhoE
MDTALRILLIRHGETEWSRSGRHTGRTDVPLTPVGEKQAASVGARLQRLSFSRVFTSPLQRAARTAELAGFDARLEVDRDLVEWDYGSYEGRRTRDIQAERPGWNVFRDGCPNGEGLHEVAARADRAVARLRCLGGDVAVFSHAHFLRVLTARWLRLDPLTARCLVVQPAGIGLLGYEHGSPDEPVILKWNEACDRPL